MSQNYTEKPVSQLRAAHAPRTPRTREIREIREIRESAPPARHPPDKLGYEPGSSVQTVENKVRILMVENNNKNKINKNVRLN